MIRPSDYNATVRIPWPPRKLFPNARRHGLSKSDAVKQARADAVVACKEVMPQQGTHIVMVAHPPDRRRRDLDGLLAAMKPSIDGISDFLGIDDSEFSFEIWRGEPKPGGEVAVTIVNLDEWGVDRAEAGAMRVQIRGRIE